MLQKLAKTRGVRGAAAGCALCAVAYLAAQRLLDSFFSFLMGLRVPGASLADPVGYTAGAAGLLRLLAAAGALALPVWGLLYYTRLRAADLRLLLPARWSPLFCLGLFLGLANLGNLLGGLLARLLGIKGTVTALPAGGPGLLAAFLLLCVLPAVGEELLFRGAMQGLMRPCGSGAAILAPALLFALLHLDLTQGLTALVCGLFLGWLVERTGSILPGMLLHLINNCLAFLNLYLQLYAPQSVALGVGLCILLGCPLAGGVLLWRAMQQDFHFEAGLRPGPGARAVFGSPVYTVVVLWLLGYTVWLGVAA